MIVAKFGGTSVGSAERMGRVAELINDSREKIVVLSAVAGTTNALVDITTLLYARETNKAAKKIDELHGQYKTFIKELYQSGASLKKARELTDDHFEYIHSFTQDMFTIYEERAILAQGELISTALFHYYLQEKEVKSVLLPALNFMRTDSNGEPDLPTIESNLRQELAKYPQEQLFITQGYICRNAFGEVDNLKRGGSDYTASLIGAVLGAEEIQIWTDIDGMHNNDPRVVKNTRPIAELNFDEAAELAYFGAKILHPSSVRPAREKNIPVRLLNTMQPEAKGTTISKKNNGNLIKAVAAKDGITAIKIRSGRMLMAYGFLRSVFEVFERYKTPIDMITTSEVAVSLTIDDATHLDKVVKELENYGRVEVDREQTIICVVGSFMAHKSGNAHRIFTALQEIPIRMISYGGSQHNVSVLVKTADKEKALHALHRGLFTE